jgi:hypothetical protein
VARIPLARLARLAGLAVLALLAGALISGCGAGDRVPSLKRLPLVQGGRVTTQLRSCNPGANAYCAIELVVVGTNYPSAQALVKAESRLLHRRGWHHANAPVGQEIGATSPGDRLRVTYATASGELEAIDLGWIKRPRALTLTLSRALFAHTSAMAVVLQVGTS